MNVLMLCTESPTRIWGGRGKWIQSVPPQLIKRGVGLHLVTWDEQTKDLPYRFSVPRDRVRVWPTDNDEQKILLMNQARLVRHCVAMWSKGYRWDLIHAHEWDMAIPALELRDLFGTPVVTQFHLFQEQLAEEVATEAKRRNDTDQHPLYCEAAGWVESDAVITVSENMAHYGKERWGERHVDVILNAVDFADVRGSDKFVADKPIVLYCGRLAEQKGINHFLDAAELDDRYRWVVMGKTAAMNAEDAERTPWMQRIRKMEKLPQFKYLGHLEGQDRADWLTSADVVVMPSLHEPFGIVALEAMASGAVLLQTGVNGLAEFCNDSNSIRIEPNARSIVAAVNRAIIEREESAIMTRNAHETAKRFTWGGVADRVVSCYRRIIDQTSEHKSTFTHWIPSKLSTAAFTAGKL